MARSNRFSTTSSISSRPNRVPPSTSPSATAASAAAATSIDPHDKEILEDRYGRRSTIVTSQAPVEHWHQLIGDPIYADAILDRLVHNATRIDLTGESLRRKRTARQQTA